MRRALLLLITLLLSFKAVAAGVVPIVGAPGHLHHPDSASQFVPALAVEPAAHVGCSGHANEPATPSEDLHEHSCPHLGMVSMVATLPAFEPRGTHPDAMASRVIRLSSVDLDVPSPPPTQGQ
jgi:hypothetical protein